IINELEAAYRGAGWHVIKLLWGGDWDEFLARDTTGLLLKRMEECVDGEYQSFKAKGGAYIRKEFWGKYPELLKMVEHLSDDQLGRMRRGGHDPQKVYNAYKRAVENTGAPTVILAKTVKGYGLGPAESRNPTHQEKKLSDETIEYFRKRFDIPIPDEAARNGSFYRPPDDSPENVYLHARRRELGGYLPARIQKPLKLDPPSLESFDDSITGSKGRAVSTTMAFVNILKQLLKDPKIGKHVVPIIPDEGRTFGMESVIRQIGIYASQGQLYKPHDMDMLLYYKEAKDGQLLEEGITEAGSMASFAAAGTAYANYGVDMIPFFTYYSMFGFQRIGDLIWAFADSRGKGFLMGGTAGRTTLSGEGLQHQDGHSIVLASTVPTCATYDPAFAYELAVIIQDGIRRMYQEREDLFYYITIYNEDYAQPEMPQGVTEGILKGLYKLKSAENGKGSIQLFGSGPMVNEALRAQSILAEKYGVHADVWSVTSYNELRRDALRIERWNRLHPAEPERRPHLLAVLDGVEGPIVAASDYMKVVPDQLAPWL
ncbi:MAG: pyruvate dehydrogenase (acetyl-transferring), homodimeric type, partial [Phycisphaerales bacterium]|nr:pyruvate dehydrogenase (acetyl-transferring), homodimeric type [Phycisphaerales bacterium]